MTNINHIFEKRHLYIQKERYSCGPVTIRNYIKNKFNIEKSEEELISLCGATPTNGSENEGLINALKKLDININESNENSSIEKIETLLKQNKVLIVNYINSFKGTGHYALIIGQDDIAFYFIDSTLGYLRLQKDYFDKFWSNKNGTIKKWFIALEGF